MLKRDCLRAPRAHIESVDEFSPADDAGFYPGCYITAVDGQPVRDILDWRWKTDKDEIVVSYLDAEGDEGEVELVRDEGEDWGFNFSSAIFDELIQCRNACIFCFMAQLPAESRDSLSLRDDDYRLSFLQGNFVTFTNIGPEDEARIIEQHISPLRYSLHCVTPELRTKVIGKHAAHGIGVAERLLAAGIDLHVQIVLMPNINDGEELRRTLQWCYERPGIQSVGIVPLGFTKHQQRFETSFNDKNRAREVIECIRPFQMRAASERRDAWVHVSDEFYRNAYPENLLEELPPASFYGDFELYEDGIGILRSFVDDWEEHPEAVSCAAKALKACNKRVVLVYGCAMRETMDALLKQSPLKGYLVPLYVKNDYFGGNVDVTGLLCGCDIVGAVKAEMDVLKNKEIPCAFVAIPRVIFNADQVTLDDMTLDQMQQQLGIALHVVSCDASDYLIQISNAVTMQ